MVRKLKFSVDNVSNLSNIVPLIERETNTLDVNAIESLEMIRVENGKFIIIVEIEDVLNR